MAGSFGRSPVDVLDKTSLAAMNLNVVKRIDPFVDELLASAGHIVLYDYNISTKSWTHKGVEGTLFLVKRRVPPSFQYIVLNKKSQDHHVEDIDSGFKYEMSEREGKTFLLYKNAKHQVVGIWFYDKTECDKVVTLLDQIAALPPQATPSNTAVHEAAPSLYPPISHTQSNLRGPQHAAAGNTPRGHAEEGFWDAGVSGQTHPPANKLLSQNGQRYEPATAAGPNGNGALDPLQRLFGAGNAGPANMGSSQSSQRQPSAAVPVPHSVPAAVQTMPNARQGGLPPFRNASITPASSQGLENIQPAASPSSIALPPTIPPLSSGSSTPFAALQTQAQLPVVMPPASSGKATSLLKPSFFAAPQSTPTIAPSAPQGMGQSSASPALPPLAEIPLRKLEAKPGQGLDNNLLRFFTPKNDAASLPASGSSPQSTEPNSMSNQMHKDRSSRQVKVRDAVKALAASDAFIDLLVAELEKTGAFS